MSFSNAYFIQFSRDFSPLTDTGNVVIDKLANESKAIELVRLNNLVKSLGSIQNDLEIMKDETKNLRIRASQLSDGLRGVKRELLTQLSKCNTKDCKAIKEKYDIGRLDTNGIDYNQVWVRFGYNRFRFLVYNLNV